MLLGAAQAEQQFETLKIANLLEQQLNWGNQQTNWLGSSENGAPAAVVANKEEENRYHHPYMDLSPMEHYHHGPEYLHGYHGHHLPHHYYKPDSHYDYYSHHGQHYPDIHHGVPDYGHYYAHGHYSPHSLHFSRGMDF